MKQLISATLSKEAAEVYNNWERQKKSAILSDLIVKEHGNREHIIALQRRISLLQQSLSKLNVRIKLKEGLTPLVEDINKQLEGTIYYQYWENSDLREVPKSLPKTESPADKMNREFFEKTGEHLF